MIFLEVPRPRDFGSARDTRADKSTLPPALRRGEKLVSARVQKRYFDCAPGLPNREMSRDLAPSSSGAGTGASSEIKTTAGGS